MKLRNSRTLRGPNYWSVQHPQLIVLTIEEEKEDNRGILVIKASLDRAINTKHPETFFPQLYAHQEEQGFAAHLVSDLFGMLQSLAGTEIKFQKTTPLNKGQFKVICSYEHPLAGLNAGERAVALANDIISGKAIDLQSEAAAIKEVLKKERLGPSTAAVVHEAEQRGIPVIKLDDSFIQLGYGAAQRRIEATLASTTGSIAVDIAGNKHRTKQILRDAFLPVPQGEVLNNRDNLKKIVEDIAFPVVIKPLDGNQGKGATIGVHTIAEAEEAFERAKKYSASVVVEKMIEGKDFRALVINYKFVAAAVRTPAAVTGDGFHTISQLIDIVNKDPKRGTGHCNMLTAIVPDAGSMELLQKRGYTLDSIPKRGEEVYLKSTANLSTGGTAEDVTDSVHPFNIALFERAARTVGLDICGIDVMAEDLRTPITNNGGAIIEVNAAPGIRMHLDPTSGQSRNVAKPIIDMLFPYEEDGRIPIIAVTGTNGKTTSTRLVASMAQQGGYNTGFTTTDGIYINKQLIYKGDCSGPQSAKVVLKDTAVEFAVLESARGGILRSGLGFDRCDCAIVTNVAADHLGLDGIHTLEQLAQVKAVVPKSVKRDGYAVLNADDDLVYAMKEEVTCRVALFSLDANNKRVAAHCAAGGVAAVVEEGYIIIRDRDRVITLEHVENIPVTYSGKATFNVANVLAASLAAYLTNITLPAIRCTLRNFKTSATHTPGRLNIFEFKDFTIMMDYAHNPHGLKALGDFVSNIEASKKVGIITGVGDRRNEDIIALGREAAKIFDEIIIRHDDDLRGRTEFEISALLRSGIQQEAPDKNIFYFSDEMSAIEFALDTTVPGALIILLAEKIEAVREKLETLQQQSISNHQTIMRVAV